MSLRAAFPSDSPDLSNLSRLGIPRGSDFNGRPAAAVPLAREHHHGLNSGSPGAFSARFLVVLTELHSRERSAPADPVLFVPERQPPLFVPERQPPNFQVKRS